ncbi:hypothetical protein Leryth_008358 [Lithospermum erythrorhizon]|nr:hypothetical protein Leryth_008358 [Lithospermum erythrorhizon]
MAPENQHGCGTLAPLLPEVHHQHAVAYDHRRRGGGSFSGAIFNVSTGMVGAGIMSIPATFKVLGIIPSFVVILLMAFFVKVTVEFLLKYTHFGEAQSYGGLVHESFGKFGAVGLQLCVMITNLGALIIYLIIIGNELNKLMHKEFLQERFGDHWWTSTVEALALFINSLRHASALSILLAVLFVLMCSGMALYAMCQGRTETPKLVPDFSHGFYSLYVHPIRAELHRQSEMSAAVCISLIVCVAIYLAVGFFGYLLFGESIMAEADCSGVLRARTRFFLSCITLLAFTYLAAISFPNIWYFFQFMGTTTGMCLMFIFPSAIILRYLLIIISY